MPYADPNKKKEMNRVYLKAHYKKHPKYYYERNKLRRKELHEKIIKYLNNHHCVDCGESDIVVLEFDHVRGKKYLAVSQMVRQGLTWSRIEREIEKCDVRCANCHKRVTANIQRWAKNHKRKAHDA